MEVVMTKDVMVRLDGSRADEARVTAADQIAEYFDSHIVCLFVNILPMPIVEEDDGAGAIESVRLIEAARAVGDKKEAKLRERLARLQKPFELRRFDTFGGTMTDIAAREAR